MPSVVVFEVAGQVRQAMAREPFQTAGVIGLDAYPYRLLDRGRPYLAVFAELSEKTVAIVALGRVVPGDRSGVSNRNLEFDHCSPLPSAVPVPSDDPLAQTVRDAVAKRKALIPAHGEKLLDAIAAASPSYTVEIGALCAAVLPNVVEGKAGFVLSCERDAVALALKAANLTTQLSGLSAWVGEPKETSFVTGLEEASEPTDLWNYPEHEVLPFDRDQAPHLGYMRVSRAGNGSGAGLTLVGIRPGGGSLPDGTALVYFHSGTGALVVLGYSGNQSRINMGLSEEIDDQYAGTPNPNDPRMVATPGFVKEAAYNSFDAATADRLLPGEIRAATHLREWSPQAPGPFDSRRHLSNSTFAALLGAGWLGGRAAGYRQVREVVELLLQDYLAVVIAVHSHRDAITLSAD